MLLRGPAAAQLWQVSQHLARLEAHRTQLIAALRPGAAPALPPQWGAPAPAQWGTPPAPPQRVLPPPREWTPQRVQNLLLSVGVLLVAIAAVIFTAFAWGHLPLGLRAAVMAAATLAAAALAAVAHRRTLHATAESLATLAVALALVDAYAARRAGLLGLGDTDPATYWSAATGVVAVLAAGFGRAVPVRAPRFAALLLAQLPVVMTAARLHSVSAPLRTVPVIAQGGALLLLARTASDRNLLRALAPFAILSGSVTIAVGMAVAGGVAFRSPLVRTDARNGAAALAFTGGVLAAVALVWRDREEIRTVVSAASTAALAVAGFALAHSTYATAELPAAFVAIGLLLLVAAAALPKVWQPPPLVVASGAVAVSVALVLRDALTGLAGPLAWLEHPWRLRHNGPARGLLAPNFGWRGTHEVLAVLLVAAFAAIAVAERLDRRRAVLPASVVVTATAVLLVPLGANWSYDVALAWNVAAGLALLASGVAVQRRRPLPGVGLAAVGTVVLAVALAWSLASRDRTVLLVGVVAVAYALAATRPGPARAPAAGVAAGLLTAWATALARAHSTPVDRTGFAVACVGTAFLGVGWLLRSRPVDALVVEGVGVGGYVIGASLAGRDSGWLFWTLVLGALTAFVLALRADRRWAAWVGCALATAALWQRLTIQHVRAPEAYAVPPAVLLLAVGAWHRRLGPVSSWLAYGPGLGLALLPSLPAALRDPGLARPLLLGAAALVVLLSGVHGRLQAPLALGAAVLAVDALAQLAPLAAGLPRWVSVGGAGLVLLALGATYEQRRRDIERFRQAFAGFG